MLFEGLCEQILDYLGTDEGRHLLYRKFPQFRTEVDIKTEAYMRGHRITRKQSVPDPQIVRICDETTL